MREREKILLTGLVVMMLIAWLGFPFHQSPRFAGSLRGGLFGVVGTVLMIVPLAYMVVKRNRRLKKYVTQWVSMRTLLAWHIYAGVLGPILILIHSGHKYESPLGIALIAMTLLVVISGFIGRYLMKQFSQEIREKKAILKTLQSAYDQAAGELAAAPNVAEDLRPVSGFFGRLIGSLFVQQTATVAAGRTTHVRAPQRCSGCPNQSLMSNTPSKPMSISRSGSASGLSFISGFRWHSMP